MYSFTKYYKIIDETSKLNDIKRESSDIVKISIPHLLLLNFFMQSEYFIISNSTACG